MQLESLFEKNRAWAGDIETPIRGFDTRLQQRKCPQYLWIGCSDSRVPANEIVGLLPGELFVHRNVANVVVHSDLNCLSVMQFAIDSLKVRHIIVVGHYGCSGVKAAMENLRIGIADNWLRHVQDVRNQHREWLDRCPEGPGGLVARGELNVLGEGLNGGQSTVVQDAWERGQEVVVHGWVYGLHNGHIKDMRMSVARPEDLAAVYAQALSELKQRHLSQPAATGS